MHLKFNVISKNSRPVILYNKIHVLFDTGASVPVWCTGANRFCGFFPGAAKQRYKYLLSGLQ